jgi:hypothetical protein
LAMLLAQMKQNKPHVHELGLFESIVHMALIGSSFTSEMFLMAAMFATPRCLQLGVVVLLGRLLHMPAAGHLLFCMFSARRGSLSSLGEYLDQDMLLKSSKVFGAAAVISTVDVTVLRYFPWLSSPFSRKSDYPTGRVFLICLCTKLLQSVITVSCQVSYFVLVNAAVTANTYAARQSLAFLVINMVTTLLLVLLNAVDFALKKAILLDGSLSKVPDVQPHQTSSQSYTKTTRSSWLMQLRPRISLASIYGGGATSAVAGGEDDGANKSKRQDVIPRPSSLMIDNPLRLSTRLNPNPISATPHASQQTNTDVEMIASTHASLHDDSTSPVNAILDLREQMSAMMLLLQRQQAQIEQLQENKA